MSYWIRTGIYEKARPGVEEGMGLRVLKARQFILQVTGPRKMWAGRKTRLKQCFRKIQGAAMCRLDGRG